MTKGPTQVSSSPSAHFTKKSLVPFSFFLSFRMTAGSTSSKRLSAKVHTHFSAVLTTPTLSSQLLTLSTLPDMTELLRPSHRQASDEVPAVQNLARL